MAGSLQQHNANYCGPVTVPPPMRDRPTHRGLRPLLFISSLAEKTRKSNRLQMSLQRQHFLFSYLKIMSVGPAGTWTSGLPLRRPALIYPTELTGRRLHTCLVADINVSRTQIISHKKYPGTGFCPLGDPDAKSARIHFILCFGLLWNPRCNTSSNPECHTRRDLELD